MATEERWRERFGEFEATFARLRAALEVSDESSALEHDGIIYRFNSAFGDAWYTLKHRLEYEGVCVETEGIRPIVRVALHAGLIDDRETWFAMLNDRNRLAHSYDADGFDALCARIRTRYLDALGDFHARFAGEAVEA